MTIPTQLVLRALLADPTQELYGVEIGTGGRPAQRDRPSHSGPAGGRSAGWNRAGRTSTQGPRVARLAATTS